MLLHRLARAISRASVVGWCLYLPGIFCNFLSYRANVVLSTVSRVIDFVVRPVFSVLDIMFYQRVELFYLMLYAHNHKRKEL